MSSLKIANARIREAVLKGVPEAGPPSLRSRWARMRYRSPTGLSAAFDEAVKIVEADAAAHRTAADNEADEKTRELHLAKSELHNPEVKYNHLVQHTDLSEPVYKLLAQRDWQRRDMLVLMQRIEQHHIIPDTLPTLAPEADVGVRFVTPNMRFIEPGEWLANDVCSRTPQISIRDFGLPAQSSAKYTVLIVNPDMPDLERDSFKTWLHFAATNVEASLTAPIANWDTKSRIDVPYVAPHPEKNAPGQRLAVWVLRQNGDLPALGEMDRDFFDIRQFVEKHNLHAVGASLWRSKWDLSSPAVREKYGLGPGRVYFRARTEKPEEALLHIRERPKWMKVDGLLSELDAPTIAEENEALKAEAEAASAERS